MATLREIVSSALQQADESIKVASLREAPIEDRGFRRVDDYLARELGQIEVEAAPTKQAAAQPEPEPEVGLDDVRFALKLAEALDYGAAVIEKIALDGPLNRSTGGKPNPGPTPAGGSVAILTEPYANAKAPQPQPQASAHARALDRPNQGIVDGHPKTDENIQLNEGPVIPDNYPNGTSRTTGSSSKHAGITPKVAARLEAQRELKSKKAQYEMLVSLGQIEAAKSLQKEADDIAGNASLIFKDNYESASFPDNTAVRNLTKAQARDRNQREAGNYFGEPVKRDNAATENLAISDGLKLSAARKIAWESKGTGAAALNGPVGTLVAGDSHNRGRRFLGSMAGNVAGGGAGAGLGALATRKSKNPYVRAAGLIGGASLGGRAGSAAGNALVQRATGDEGKRKRASDKVAWESKGTGAAALNGPAGTLVAGDSHNRGRRFLGALGGSVAGGGAGAGLGALATRKSTNPYVRAAGIIGGASLGSRAGSAAGNATVQHYTKKASDEEKTAFLGTIGGGVARGLAKGMNASQGLIAKIPGRAAGRVMEGVERGANALTNMGTTGQRVLGGATLGAAGLGTYGAGRRLIGGGGDR